MPADKRDQLALQMHMLVEGFIGNPSTESGIALARCITIMSRAIEHQSPAPMIKRTDAAALALFRIEKAFNAIVERHQRTGKYGCSGDEMKALREVSGVLNGALSTMTLMGFMIGMDQVNQEEKGFNEQFLKERQAA